MAKDLRVMTMNAFQRAPSIVASSANTKDGPVLIRDCGKYSVQAVVVTDGAFHRLYSQLRRQARASVVTAYSAGEASKHSSRILQGLRTGTIQYCEILHRGVHSGYIVSARLYEQLLESNKGLRNFNWPAHRMGM